MTELYNAETLTNFAGELLIAAGMAPSRAEAVARILVEGDLMGLWS